MSLPFAANSPSFGNGMWCGWVVGSWAELQALNLGSSATAISGGEAGDERKGADQARMSFGR